jgi:hypothetical protein
MTTRKRPNRITPITAAVRAVRLASRDWKLTPRGKIICPTCGCTGYPLTRSSEDIPTKYWIDKHAEHAAARCGLMITTKGLATHERSCTACRDSHVAERQHELEWLDARRTEI